MMLADGDALLTLLQIADSGFPTGGYAFSNGLEGMIRLGLVADEHSLDDLMGVVVEESLVGIELPIVLLAHRAASCGDVSALAGLDDVAAALKPVPATRLGSITVGRRMLASIADVLSSSIVDAYRAEVAEARVAGHHPVVFGVIGAGASLDPTATALAYGSGAIRGQVQAAVRLGLIGQAAAQRLISAARPRLAAAVTQASHLEIADVGGYQPMVDIAALRQPTLEERLFAS